MDSKPPLQDALLRVAAAARDIAGAVSTDAEPEHTKFLHRVHIYGQELPWALQWLLLTKREFNPNNSLEIVDVLLKDHPNDIDFQIKRAEILLRLDRPGPALEQVSLSLEQWKKQVETAVGIDTESAALVFFHDTKIGDTALDILHWEDEQLRLAQITALLMTSPLADQSDAMRSLIAEYPNIHLEYPQQILRVLALQHRTIDFLGLIKTYVATATEGAVLERTSTGLYHDLITYHSINVVPPDEQRLLRGSTLGRAICSEEAAGATAYGKVDVKLQGALASFCRAASK
jgi:hypothetical protein